MHYEDKKFYNCYLLYFCVTIVELKSFLLILLQSVELDGLAAYFDSDIVPWHVSKPWEDLLPSEWFKVFPVDIEGYNLGCMYVCLLFSLLFF